MITELQAQRLHLRQMKESDSLSMLKIWSNRDVTKFMNISNFTDKNQAKDMIHFLNELAQNNKALRFTIIEKESHQIIGSCGYNFLDFENSKTEIGYDISKTFLGKGYAPEAISALLDYAFTHLKLNRVEAKVEPKNVNSIKVLQNYNSLLKGL
ncbi:acetyltransferase family protein [Bacillus wiedmannii]|nr:acetyltransferase family protein [Bacillus wiedmannii]